MATLAGDVDPVNPDAVKVWVRIQGVPKTLHERDGSALRGAKTKQFLSASAQFAKQSANENVQNIAGEPRIVGHAVAQREGQRQDPLPYRYDGKHAIHQMRRHICHAPSATGGAPDASFTGKSQQPVVSAGFAPQTQKASGQNSTVEEGAEFVFNETWDRPVAFLLPAQKRFQLTGNDLIQHRLFRFSRSVFKGGIPHEAAHLQLGAQRRSITASTTSVLACIEKSGSMAITLAL
jgi:hypothetical protein